MTSPTRISDVVNNFFEERKKEVTKDLSLQYSEGRRFTLIADEWSASNGPRYVNIILKSESATNLGLVRVLGSLTSSAIVLLLYYQSILNDSTSTSRTSSLLHVMGVLQWYKWGKICLLVTVYFSRFA